MKTSYLVPKQIPEFIRTTYPAFVEFLQAYYEWFEGHYSKGKLEELVDIDRTLDEFVTYFRRQLDVYGITANLNDRDTIKRIKELYSSKGSPAGIRFLFRLIFNKQASVIHPWDYVFKPSEGKWQQDVSVLVNFSAFSPTPVFGLSGNSVILTDTSDREFETPVYSIIQRYGSVYEVFIRRIVGSTGKYTKLQNLARTITGTVGTTTTSLKIVSGGSDFEEGQLYPISTYGGNGTIVRIKRVGNVGQILSADITSFGIGYQAPFYAVINPTQETNYYLGPRIDITQSGSNPLDKSYFTDDTVEQQEQGVVVQHDYTNLTLDVSVFTVNNTSLKVDSTLVTVDKATDETVLGIPDQYMEDPSYVGTTLAQITDQDTTFRVTTASSATIQFSIGNVLVYPGQYQTSENILGDTLNIQDSFYHQAFSYVTSVDASIDTYVNILKNVMHPSGTKHFGLYNISQTFPIPPTLVSTINIVSKEFVLTDTLFVTDQTSFDFTKQLTDSALAEDRIDRDFASITESGGIYFGPYYVGTHEQTYWEIGYTDNEIPFTN